MITGKKQTFPACTAVFNENQFYRHIDENAKSFSQHFISSSDADTEVREIEEKKGEMYQDTNAHEEEGLSNKPEVEKNSPTHTSINDVMKPQDENIDGSEVEIVALGVEDVTDITPIAYNAYAEPGIPRNYNEAVNGKESQWWKNANRDEINTLERNRTFEEVN